MRTPAWATEQIEHSWLGNLELSVCTWTAWTMPVKATSRIHNKDRPTTHLSLRDLYPNAIKQNAPFANAILDIPWLKRTMLYLAEKLPYPKGHRRNSSRRRLVWARLTGISVCFLSSSRN